MRAPIFYSHMLMEEAVDHIGVELSKMLWADGWRKIDMGDLPSSHEENKDTDIDLIFVTYRNTHILPIY